MSQLNIKSAFLYGELDEEIYLQQPERFFIPGQETSVFRLHMCLYELNQASRVRNAPFDSFLRRLYIRHHKKKVLVRSHLSGRRPCERSQQQQVPGGINHLLPASGKHIDMRLTLPFCWYINFKESPRQNSVCLAARLYSQDFKAIQQDGMSPQKPASSSFDAPSK
jgi:hypothetical protein